MGTVWGRRWFCFVWALWLCLLCGGCERLQVEDMRLRSFRAEAVIHRAVREERVRIEASPSSEGELSVEWLLPEEMAGLTLRKKGDQWTLSWHGREMDGTAFRSAVAELTSLLSSGEWSPVQRSAYRGREAILVSVLRDGKEGYLYMDRQGREPLGLIMNGVEWELLWFELKK